MTESPTKRDADARIEPAPRVAPPPAPTHAREQRESVIASELTIEGKIEGAGHVRLAGRFKGDVQVQGNLSIEPGARPRRGDARAVSC